MEWWKATSQSAVTCNKNREQAHQLAQEKSVGWGQKYSDFGVVGLCRPGSWRQTKAQQASGQFLSFTRIQN